MQKPNLWNVSLVTNPAFAEILAEVVGEEALAVTCLAPPRTNKAQIDLIYGEEPDTGTLNAQLAVLALLHKAEIPQLIIKKVGNLDWLKKVAADFPPLLIARWTIFGAAHRRAIKNPRLALQINATNAFGTGEHPTTRGCLLMLNWLLKQKQFNKILDIGCGSGILAMATTKSRAGRAIAVDLDPVAVQIARDNVRLNGLQGRVHTAQSHGYRLLRIRQRAPYDLILANIFARPLCEMAKDLKQHLGPGGVAILSGLLNSQANAVLAAHRQQGLSLLKRMKFGEWSVLALHYPNKASCPCSSRVGVTRLKDLICHE